MDSQISIQQVECECESSSSQHKQKHTEKDAENTENTAGHHRGLSRALKYKKKRKSQPLRLKVDLPRNHGAVVGPHALQFISEVSKWIKEICPLNIKRWKDMPKEKLSQLNEKINANYELSNEKYVETALKKQCASLYRGWRSRLKGNYFMKKKSLKEAENACPPNVNPEHWKWLVYVYWGSADQMGKSETNKLNALSQKIHSACGAKSTAQILTEMDMEELRLSEAREREASIEEGGSQSQPIANEPKYIKVYTRLKWHSSGFDPEAEEILQKFHDLHEKQIQEKGVDELTVEEAFVEVLGYRSGYARGLGKAHPALSKGKMDTQAEMQRFRDRDSELQAEIERLKADAQRKEEEMREREAKREEEAREREAKREEEARAREAKREEEARAREAQLRIDLEKQMHIKFEEFLKRFRY